MRAWIWGLAWLCLAGCEEDPPQEAGADAATGALDTGAADADRPDGPAADGARPDATAPDTAVPEPDAAAPDAAVPDPDAAAPDAAAPDAATPDATACEPAAEVCNGSDDDCDTALDEDVPDTTCYGGPPGTAGVGRCREGLARCQVGALGPCLNDVVPAEAELCGNLIDDDCNGAVDDGCGCAPGSTLACGRDAGACVAGVQRCVDGAFGPCEGEVGPAAEQCDGEDNDCNGETDEISQACYEGPAGTEGVGLCRGGEQSCQGGAFGACEGQVLPQHVDACSGEDDDCDGAVDEDHLEVETRCGQGRCSASGSSECRNGFLVDTCVPLEPQPDLCDGIDNDCDGRTDEGHVVANTECGLAACVGRGQRICENGQIRDTCQPRVPGEEVANAADDDCDNRIDEGHPFTTAELQARFNRDCTGCHGGSGGLSLRNDFQVATVNVAARGANGIDRIEPGNPDRSYLLLKLAGTQASVGGGGGRMPTGGPFWADWELDRLRRWILAR